MYIDFIKNNSRNTTYKLAFFQQDDSLKLEDVTNCEYNINNEMIYYKQIYLLSIESSNEFLVNFFNEKKKTEYLLSIFDKNFGLLFKQNYLISIYESIDFLFKNNKNYFFIKFYIYL
jgi:hypothetical protein